MKEKTSTWFKVFALCTALGLGGTYVWRQQQKAVPGEAKTVERTALPGLKGTDPAPTPLPMEQEEAKRPTMLPGSKSLVLDPGVLPVEQENGILPAIQQESELNGRVLMPSSKSGIVTPKPRRLLPGSKSFDRILQPPDIKEP